MAEILAAQNQADRDLREDRDGRFLQGPAGAARRGTRDRRKRGTSLSTSIRVKAICERSTGPDLAYPAGPFEI